MNPASLLFVYSQLLFRLSHTLHYNLNVVLAIVEGRHELVEIRKCEILDSGLVTGDMVKEGAVVVDVAMNRDAEGKLCGDVVMEEVAEKAAYLTPVPGGIGPMTRAELMRNTYRAACRHLNVDPA